MKNRKVLFLGNGLCRAYIGDSVSWESIIKKATTNPAIPQNHKSALPAPLEIVLRTGNGVDEWAKKNSSKLYLPVDDSQTEFIKLLQRLLLMGFDDIITTNYSYELESAAIYPSPLTKNRLVNMTSHTNVDRAEGKYLIHTFNEVEYSDKTNRIWHIHGEARKPSSIIIGHYAYGNLLNHYIKHFNDIGNGYKKNQDFNIEQKYNSWLDSFVMGDVYMLGFSFNLAEMDLWWLLNRKSNEKARTGNLYFYEPKYADFDEKIELMKVYGAELVDCGFNHCDNFDYKGFYISAINDIALRFCK